MKVSVNLNKMKLQTKMATLLETRTGWMFWCNNKNLQLNKTGTALDVTIEPKRVVTLLRNSDKRCITGEELEKIL